MVPCIIDAMEGRNVDVYHIHCNFLQTYMMHGECIVCIRILGVLADLLVKIYPEKFADKVVLEGGHALIYAAFKKVLYGASIAIIIFWWDLFGVLRYWGFELNPYESCVMNKTVDGKQCTICWHVDDLNILHVSLKVVDGVLS